MSESTNQLSFGAELRSRRLAAGLSLQGLALRVNYSRSHLSKVENSLRTPTQSLARRCDVVLRADGTLASLLDRGAEPQTFDLDEPELLPLDQVWMIDYSPEGEDVFGVRPHNGSSAGFDQRWTIGPAALPGWFDPELIDGYRGTFDQLRAQGQHLGPADLIPTLVAQTQALMGLAARADSTVRDSLFLLAARFAEYTGWMAQELGHNHWAVWWTDCAAALATRGGHDLAAYRLVRLGDIAMYDGHASRTIEVSTFALGATTDPRVRGLAAQRLAHGHALAGDRDACLRALDLSHHLLGDAADRHDAAHPVIGSATVADHVAMATGWCLFDLGRPDEAARILSVEIDRLPAKAYRARARYGTRLARCYADLGELDQARAVAEPILRQLPLLNSATIRADLSGLEADLRRQPAHPAARGLMPLLAQARPGARR